MRRVSATSVHPHGRGDDGGQSRPGHYPLGSPPRAWGRLVARSGSNDPVKVHPHGRGDDWGYGKCVFSVARFTPTGVGTTRSGCVRRRRLTVHPHGRGDDGILASKTNADLGSPPRAWGRPDPAHWLIAAHRFTPTGVGTTPFLGREVFQCKVHPHGRGDDTMMPNSSATADGSPPRAWGRHRFQQQRVPISRFTPTGVGTTLSPSPSLPIASGSPPRAWGRPPHRARAQCQPRFTPTGVGTTPPSAKT